jgi:hypothetical protein
MTPSDSTADTPRTIADQIPQDLPPAARRALAEAAERRAKTEEEARKNPVQPELGGRDGLEPVRYGDWEKKGLAIDF